MNYSNNLKQYECLEGSYIIPAWAAVDSLSQWGLCTSLLTYSSIPETHGWWWFWGGIVAGISHSSLVILVVGNINISIIVAVDTPVLFCSSAALSVGQDFLLATPRVLLHNGAESWSWLFCRNRHTPHLTLFHSPEVYTSCLPELCSDFSGFLGFCLLLFLWLPLWTNII